MSVNDLIETRCIGPPGSGIFKMPRISLDLLQPFVLVARVGNLSRAAAQAQLTVSALSHQMRQLEQRVERKLFDRGPRGVTLTAEGRRLLEAMQSHREGLERTLAAYRCRRDEALTVNTLSGVMSGWLVPRLLSLLAAHPDQPAIKQRLD